MKRTILFTAALTCVASLRAQTVTDTLEQQHLDEVVVAGVRAPKSAPYAVSNIKKAELEAFSKSGRELPFLLSQIFTDEQRPFSEPLDPPRSHCPRLRGTAS